MRNIVRSYLLADAPATLQLPDTIAASTNIARMGNADAISRTIYSDPYAGRPDEGYQSRVIDKLNDWYFGKCAYCERFYKLDVEHYRPKGEIRDENNVLIRNVGYYWLGYEWSNLFPACISCNRDGGKNSKFPFLQGGTQVTTPVYDNTGNLDRTFCLINNQTLIGELPALLNPETDNNIDSYFTFEVDGNNQGIRILGVDNDRRGEITANICKLNRPELMLDRLQNVVMEFVNAVHSSIAIIKQTGNPKVSAILLNTLIQSLYDNCKRTKLSHTMLRKFIVASSKNFEEIVIPFVVPQFQKILLNAFKNYEPS